MEFRGGLYDPNDLTWAKQQGVTIITIDDFYNMGMEKVMSIVKDTIGDTEAYLTFDIDGIESYACTWNRNT